ncbi:MAG: hypothetical protein V4686_00480 [Patescibacteria group bacterium]
MKILFLCRGNVGRSQMAEFLMKKNFGDTYDVISAGTKLSGPEEEIGNLTPAINEVLEVMNEEGIDVSKAIRNQVTEEMVNSSDKVIALLEDEELPEYLVDSPKVIRWYVVDPKGKDLDETRKIKDEIKELILNMDFK